MSSIISSNQFPHFKKFKCEKCGKVYVSETTGGVGSVLSSYLSSKKANDIKTNICNHCEDVTVGNFLKRGKNVYY